MEEYLKRQPARATVEDSEEGSSMDVDGEGATHASIARGHIHKVQRVSTEKAVETTKVAQEGQETNSPVPKPGSNKRQQVRQPTEIYAVGSNSDDSDFEGGEVGGNTLKARELFKTGKGGEEKIEADIKFFEPGGEGDQICAWVNEAANEIQKAKGMRLTKQSPYQTPAADNPYTILWKQYAQRGAGKIEAQIRAAGVAEEK